MKTIKEYLGKVSITCNGLWDVQRQYDRLCLVHDGFFASYISRKEVPAGIPLTNTEYWQPVANLRDDVKIHAEDFEAKVIQLIADIQIKLKNARIVVATEAERDALTFKEIAPGCEVYIIETQQTWILDSIVCSDIAETSYKQWHLESDGKIDSEEKYELEGEFDNLTSDRAICDAYGNIIHDTYITRDAIHNYVDSVIDDFISNWRYEIENGTITYDMLSESLKQFIGSNGNITNMADEEDLTVANNQLKFKDREYNKLNFTGKGYKILRKNWMNNVNLLEQSMINEENTIYEIRYLFTLNCNTINIPKGSILWFKGGQINDGTVICDETLLFGINKFEDAGNATYNGTFSIGQIMYIDDHLCWWNGQAWIDFATGSELKVVKVIDNLESTDIANALSANQGRILKGLIDAKIGIDYNVVSELPATGEKGIIYLILNDESTEDTNVYDEYIWITSSSEYEKLGSFTTNVDLSNYATKEELNNYLPLTGGTLSGNIIIGDSNQNNTIKNSQIILQHSQDNSYYNTTNITPSALVLGSNNYNGFTSITINTAGIRITGKTNNDILNANGGTTKIKTINSQSLLGEGNIDIESGDTLPTDGTTGQVLTKTSNGYAWQDPQAGDAFPEGGTVGQVLKKTADGVEWGDDNNTQVTINNTLTSTSTTEALSAAQGKVLNDKIDALDIPDEYELPIASSTQLGGVKVGEGLEVTKDGTLSTSTTSDVNIVKCTQTEYDNNQSKDSNTLYIIYG